MKNSDRLGSRSVIAVLAPMYPPAFLGGGPIRSTEALIAHLPPGQSALVLTSDRDLGGQHRLNVESNVWVENGSTPIYYASLDKPRRLLASYRAVRARRPRVIYLNSYFHFTLSILPQLLWQLGYWGRTVRLVAPRGEFGRGALMHSALKKRIFLYTYRLLRLHRTVVWHASTDEEAKDIRAVWGEQARIIVRENETLLPQNPKAPSTAPRNGDYLEVAFVGRLVEHKGLLLVLEGLSNVKAPVRVRVLGAEEDADYALACKEAARGLPGHVEVEFCGAVQTRDVHRVLNESDVMVMPTAGENFGHAIAEALSVSCPVICSDTTPWTEVLVNGGGRIVSERTSIAWGTALGAYSALSTAQRLENRFEAGGAYEKWSSARADAHLFIKLEQLMGISLKC